MIPSTLTDITKTVVNEEMARLKARLKWREDDIRLAVAEAVMNGEDVKASSLFPAIGELSALQKDIQLRLEFRGNSEPKPEFQIAQQPPALEPTKAPGRRIYGLRAFLSGVKIEERTDASTFASAIDAIGCQAVADLGLVANYCPLVSRERQKPVFGGYRRQMQVRQRGEWFIVTHSSTSKKASVLKEIARRLHVELLVETSWTI